MRVHGRSSVEKKFLCFSATFFVFRGARFFVSVLAVVFVFEVACFLGVRAVGIKK